jgi:hypothetical protein
MRFFETLFIGGIIDNLYHIINYVNITQTRLIMQTVNNSVMQTTICIICYRREKLQVIIIGNIGTNFNCRLSCNPRSQSFKIDFRYRHRYIFVWVCMLK